MGLISNVLVGDAVIEVDGYVVGYTTDGATLTITSSFADIKVEELVGTIIRRLTDQEVRVQLTMAEGTLDDLFYAIPGSELLSTVLFLGGGDLQDFQIVFTCPKPGGGNRVITLTHCNPIGEVGIPYKKGEISVVPVTFSALVDDTGVFGTIDDT